MGYPVNSPVDNPGSAAAFNFRDISTTIQNVSLPSGAKALIVNYQLLPGATAVTNQFAKYVVNASSDADAIARLGTGTGDNGCFWIRQGEPAHEIGFSPGNEATRVDFVTEAAVGAEKTIFTIKAVLS
jgi:hypothetical protein